MQNVLPDVNIEQFEGPYDLLVELAKKKKISLSEISLSELTSSFIAYIKSNNIPAEIIGSFLIVASTLLLVKIRQCLPKLEPEEDEEIADLQHRLALYELYRAASEQLAFRWDTVPLLPAHFFAEGTYKEPHENIGMPSITSNTLATAFTNLIGRIPPAPQATAHLTKRGTSLKDIFALFTNRLRTSKKLNFQETVQGSSRQDQAISFLAILEMAKKGHVQLEQQEAFGTLLIHKL